MCVCVCVCVCYYVCVCVCVCEAQLIGFAASDAVGVEAEEDCVCVYVCVYACIAKAGAQLIGFAAADAVRVETEEDGVRVYVCVCVLYLYVLHTYHTCIHTYSFAFGQCAAIHTYIPCTHTHTAFPLAGLLPYTPILPVRFTCVSPPIAEDKVLYVLCMDV